MKKVVVYVHGKDGLASEANHYKKLFNDYDVIGFDYKANTPMEALEEFSRFFNTISKSYEYIILIANSIGAYFSMMSINPSIIDKAYLISPIVDMEYLIKTMMDGYKITEEELKKRRIIKTTPDDEITWEYLTYARNNPIKWNVETYIIYGDKDFIIPRNIIEAFAIKTNAKLTIVKNQEHWFHTNEEMDIIDKWISNM